MTTPTPERPLKVWRCAATGAVLLGLLAALSWAGSELGLNSVPIFLGMYPRMPMGHELLIPGGLIWAMAMGAFLGAALAVIYNALGRLGR